MKTSCKAFAWLLREHARHRNSDLANMKEPPFSIPGGGTGYIISTKPAIRAVLWWPCLPSPNKSEPPARLTALQPPDPAPPVPFSESSQLLCQSNEDSNRLCSFWHRGGSTITYREYPHQHYTLEPPGLAEDTNQRLTGSSNVLLCITCNSCFARVYRYPSAQLSAGPAL
mmetsp:Transcript_7045/g.19868  ORF Transcript_7045/g.19868 Transcript_7045/m.19868 type:complete len:170 (+) Transcript_7045:1377-1886(+)